MSQHIGDLSLRLDEGTNEYVFKVDTFLNDIFSSHAIPFIFIRKRTVIIKWLLGILF